MIRKINYSLLLFIIFSITSAQLFAQKISQEEKDFIIRINEADGFFVYDENYHAAVKIYEELFKLKPNNHNLAYKLGICYLNIQGSELKSLDLLRFASENYVEDIEYSTLGSKAPLDVLYYLAFSCQVNFELEEAIEYYEKYKNLLQVKDASEIEYTNIQIEACKNILEATKEGIILIKKLFTSWFNEYRNAVNPVISQNDSVLAFTVTSSEGNRIFWSNRIDGDWAEPVDITSRLGKYRDMFTNSISGDGKKMIVCRNNGHKADLYLAELENKEWTKISKLNKNINTRYWESHGAITANGKRLYFSSNKPGGYGSLDIYYSDLEKNNSFGPAVNLGPVINSKLEENTPFIDEVGSIYFSSTGHIGFGGYDIFYSSYENNKWTEPVHLSFPLNTPTDNLHYVPYGSFNTGIYSMAASDTASYSTVFSVTHGIRPETDRVIARGQITLGDGMKINPDYLKLGLFQGKDNIPVVSLSSDSEGRFSYGVDSLLYSLIISYPGYKADTATISIPESFSGSMISVRKELVPVSVARGEFFSVKNILFDFNTSSLDRDAQIELEKIIPPLISNSSLKIELKGFTDAVGSAEYNLKLSSERAKIVYNYLVNAGIDPSRMTFVGLGESGFISLNKNPDGSDNPEGRKYNRRVSVSIVNNGYEIFVESNRFIPSHLRRIHRLSYYVVIKESEIPLSPDFFMSSQLGELTLVNEIIVEDSYKYCVGEFTSRIDAINFLSTVREYGFSEAYISDEYELSEEDVESNNTKLYTIQIHALLNPSDKGIGNLKNVRTLKGTDGFYRYIVGEYRGYSRALEALKTIRALGYSSAYIKDFSLLESQSLINQE